MEKENKVMFKLYELRDSLTKTSKTIVEKIDDEKALIETIKSTESLKDTELGKELINQTSGDIEQRLSAKSKLDEKIASLDKLLGWYETADPTVGTLIDDVANELLLVLVGKDEK